VEVRERVPDHEGAVRRDGITVGYAVFDSGAPTALLAELP